MFFKVLFSFFSILFATFFATPAFAIESEVNSSNANTAELFGLPLNDLSLSELENKMNSLGFKSYPSYKEGVTNYSLGRHGVLGVKNAAIFYNRSGYIRKTHLSGTVNSSKNRQKLGNLLEQKYGKPHIGMLDDGYGRAEWQFEDGTRIAFYNATTEVSITYADGTPKAVSRSGSIDVEALARRSR
ncbi:uridine kinase [Marinomonas sp. C2222]|uniref:Uridine kinase n=1 Tax=Marinomonas sargassi TaxID=2984494 RepID=A0ABT2YUW5_9GAMM|nr:uridine kinase [Marinomonas sargassi]MCV2403653.1 uridine kinase [Marinomonas sargassi]